MLAGGGAVEAALSIYLENFATTLGSREQLAIAEFADALLVIPKTLTVNAAQDATELVAKLRAYHHAAQTRPDKKHLAHFGLDLFEGTLRNNITAGVLEPAMSKLKMLQVGMLLCVQTVKFPFSYLDYVICSTSGLTVLFDGDNPRLLPDLLETHAWGSSSQYLKLEDFTVVCLCLLLCTVCNRSSDYHLACRRFDKSRATTER